MGGVLFDRDLEYAIIHGFDLKGECANGVCLSLDGCLLPSSQPIGLIREGDLLT